MKQIKRVLEVRDLIKKFSIVSIEKVTIKDLSEAKIFARDELVRVFRDKSTKQVRVNWTTIGQDLGFTESGCAAMLDTLPPGIRVEVETQDEASSYVKAETGDWILDQKTDLKLGRALMTMFMSDGYIETEATADLVYKNLGRWMPRGKFDKFYSEAIASLKKSDS